VQRYAIELARAVDPELLEDPSTEYGFLLHDVGKIGIPDRILQKPEPLTTVETRLMKTHTVLGEQVLSGVAFFHGEGLRIVRSHHERWDGIPRRVAGRHPLAARVFAAPTPDAIRATDRTATRRWVDEGRELVGSQANSSTGGRGAFVGNEAGLRSIRAELESGGRSAAAARSSRRWSAWRR
jgi:ribonuclease P protein subunit RPR2